MEQINVTRLKAKRSGPLPWPERVWGWALCGELTLVCAGEV